MSIVLESITKRFAGQAVVDQVTDEVPTGSLTALLGPSGSGKSTILRLIAGLTPLDAGRVLLHGRDVTGVAPRHRRIGFCFQDYAPFRQMTVADNVAFGLRVQRVPRPQRQAEVARLLELVRLTGLEARYPHQLSGGQRQRMALARALAIRPEVLLLDEPFAALDAQVRGELRGWVKSLVRELGVTTILVTHDQSEAMEIADRLVILRDGRVEQVGAPAEVYERPASDWVRGFLGPVTTLEGRAVRPHEIVLHPADGPGVAATVVDVVRLGFEVRVITRTATGEDTWVQLTHDEARRLDVAVGDRVSLLAPVSAALV